MPTYQIQYTETVKKTVNIAAENEKDALMQAEFKSYLEAAETKYIHRDIKIVDQWGY